MRNFAANTDRTTLSHSIFGILQLAPMVEANNLIKLGSREK